MIYVETPAATRIRITLITTLLINNPDDRPIVIHIRLIEKMGSKIYIVPMSMVQ
ncbi:hypothetical protein ACFLXU_03375 [Chloroflexota bacterium]